jgi:hypothetical protein
MTKPADRSRNLGHLSNQIYSLLDGLDPQDRHRVLNSVTELFGDTRKSPDAEDVRPPGGPAGPQHPPAGQHGKLTPQQYFVAKAPLNKGEMLAVAARYREEYHTAQSHTKDDFAKFFTDARQNFDRNNFQRDVTNAQLQAQLFTKGMPKGQYQLSYYGQQYVDALPDREAVKNIRRPGRKTAKRKPTSRRSSK